MSERSSRSRAAARDEGAPDAPAEGVITSAVRGGQSVPATHTIAPADVELDAAQAAVVAGSAAASGLPVDPAQVERPDPLDRLDVPTAAPSGAPAGSVWGDATVDRQPSQLNEHDGGPRLAYVVTWAQAAVHVTPSKVKTRTIGEGDDAHEEKYVTVASSTGSRDVVLEGQQVTLVRGEALPEETVEGQGAFLVSIGGAVPVSIPASSPAS